MQDSLALGFMLKACLAVLPHLAESRTTISTCMTCSSTQTSRLQACRLQLALRHLYHGLLQIEYKPRRVARVVGKLAEKPLRPGQSLQGVLVRRGQQHSIMQPEELPSFTTLHTGKVGAAARCWHMHCHCHRCGAAVLRLPPGGS